MKKYAALLLAGSIIWGGISCPAADISLTDELYIPQVDWYSGSVSAGNKLEAMHTGSSYRTIIAQIDVEKNSTGASAKEVMVTGEVVDGQGTVKTTKVQTNVLGSHTTVEISFDQVEPQTDQDKIRIMIWDGVERMTPLTKIQELRSSSETMSQTEKDMQTIKERIKKTCNLYSITANPQPIMNKLGANGRFNDIDYSDRGEPWHVNAALSNVTTMLQAYYSEGNSWYRSSELFAGIEAVLRDWAANQYTSTNWWYQEIDVPGKLSQILMYPLPEDADYMPALRTLALKGMPKMDESRPHKSTDTGGNLTDKLQTAAKIAAATGDAGSMKNVVQYLLDNELSIFSHLSSGEGIMTDGSFHQHGALFYNGSYGSVFCSGVNKLLGYLTDTEFMVSERALNTYADFILDGHSMFFRGSGSDFACFGRAISRPGGVGGSVKSDSLGAVNVLVNLPGVERREELLELKNSRLGAADRGLEGAKHFWTSDFTVLHRDQFYVSVRNSSKRNKNTEYMNGENSKGYYIADGATVIMKTGREYYNIFPSWDWSKIPGTTATYLPFASIPSPAAEWGQKEFVGGVSNGRYAVSAMDYSHGGVDAKKANFLFDDGFTALGAGITGTKAGSGVYTTLNQCLLSGDVIYSDGAQETNLPKEDERTVSDVSWVLHDGVGYYFPQNKNVTLGNSAKSGTWKSINSSKSEAAVTQDIFTLSLSHGMLPANQTYSYTVLPDVTPEGMRAYRSEPDMVEITNTAKSQAVWSKKANSAGIVFWSQGIPNYKESVTIPAEVTGLGRDLTITAEKDPCLVLLTKKGAVWELSVSNPKNSSLAQTSISIDRELSGENAVTEAGKTTVTVELPQGLEQGKTAIVQLTE